MDDRNVALSEHAVINDAETTDYDENTMPASPKHGIPPALQHHHPQLLHSVFVHSLWIIISWRVLYTLHGRGLLYFHPFITFCLHLLGYVV